jgi:hypothetical protein
MANVLTEQNKQQVLALGRLGWSLRQIQRTTHIRRETASQYLKAGRNRRATTRRLGAAGGKTGQRSDHRLWREETPKIGRS